MSKLAEWIQNTVVAPGRLALCWLGGAGFVFKTASGRVVAVDPYLSDSLDHYYSWKRLPLSPTPMAPAELQADLVLATHAHEDHLDPETIPELVRATKAVVAGPRMCAEAMRSWGLPTERIVEINRGESRSIAGVDVSAVLAQHVSPAGAQTPDAVGFVLDLDGIVVYHTGDSLYHPELRQQVAPFHPHLLLVCINGQYGNMDSEEAARLTCEVGPAAVIPMHWGLVAENTADPAAFVSALGSLGGRARPMVILPGDAIMASFERI
jgi:L-ascorbate metabolism protein UlaG (beta-lactamase superfamily)